MVEHLHLPGLSLEQYEQLKGSIAVHGVMVPVLRLPDGSLLDGEHRQRACLELGIDCPELAVAGGNEWERGFALNVARRHMPLADRLALVREYLRRHAEESNRAIAAMAGTSDHTVASIRQQETGELSPEAEQRAIARSRQGDYQEAAENYADHRNECFFELLIGYAAPSESERTRAGLPYPQASERLAWHSGRLYLTSPAPQDDRDMVTLLQELARRVQREVAIRPLRTMRAATAAKG